MNQCTFLGRLTRDPEIRYAKESQMPIARFSIAVDRRRNADNEPNADFFPCVVFDRRAEFAEKYLRSGMRILISGSIQNNNYTNKDGEKVYGMELVGNLIEFADGKTEQQGNPDSAPTGKEARASGQTGTRNGSRSGAASRSGQTSRAAGNSSQMGSNMTASGSRTASTRAAGIGRTSGTSGTSRARTTTSGVAASGNTAGRTASTRTASRAAAAGYNGFMNISDGVEDEGLPFN